MKTIAKLVGGIYACQLTAPYIGNIYALTIASAIIIKHFPNHFKINAKEKINIVTRKITNTIDKIGEFIPSTPRTQSAHREIDDQFEGTFRTSQGNSFEIYDDEELPGYHSDESSEEENKLSESFKYPNTQSETLVSQTIDRTFSYVSGTALPKMSEIASNSWEYLQNRVEASPDFPTDAFDSMTSQIYLTIGKSHKLISPFYRDLEKQILSERKMDNVFRLRNSNNFNLINYSNCSQKYDSFFGDRLEMCSDPSSQLTLFLDNDQDHENIKIIIETISSTSKIYINNIESVFTGNEIGENGLRKSFYSSSALVTGTNIIKIKTMKGSTILKSIKMISSDQCFAFCNFHHQDDPQTSFLQLAIPREIFRNLEELTINKWIVNNLEIRLVNDNENVMIHWYNAHTNESNIEELDINLNQSDMINLFQNIQPLLNYDGTIIFKRPILTFEIDALSHDHYTSTEKMERRRVTLLENSNKLIWQIFSPATNKTVQNDVTCSTKVTRRARTILPSYEHSSSVHIHNHFINEINSLEDRVKFLANTLRIAYIDYPDSTWHETQKNIREFSENPPIFYRDGEQIISPWQFEPEPTDLNVPNPDSFSIYLEPISVSSRIDSQLLVSPFVWGISLIRFDGPGNNHAQLVIEGIAQENMHVPVLKDHKITYDLLEAGKYFMLVSDFDGEKNGSKSTNRKRLSIVKIHNFSENPDKIKFIGRTQVWKLESSRLLKLLNEISEEAMHPETLPRLNIFGSNSIFSKSNEESCFTWARKKLESVNIHLIEDTNQFNIASITSLHTKPNDYFTNNSTIGGMII